MELLSDGPGFSDVEFYGRFEFVPLFVCFGVLTGREVFQDSLYKKTGDYRLPLLRFVYNCLMTDVRREPVFWDVFCLRYFGTGRGTSRSPQTFPSV